MGDAVVHFEISGPDHEGTAKFFAELLGWEILRSIPEMYYTTVDTKAGDGINGGFGSPPNGAKYETVYAAVDDLKATLDKAESLGGKTLMDITEVPGIVTMAMFSDPAGNPVGIIKNEGEAVLPGSGDGSAVDWFEILGPDGEALKTFYGELFGWTFQQAPGESPYFMSDTGAGRGINGGVGQSQDGQAQVNVYAKVDDLQKTVDQTEAAGGTTVLPPTTVEGASLSFALIADPKGSRFGLYTGSM